MMNKQLQHHNKAWLIQESVLNHFHNMYVVLFMIEERFHHHLLMMMEGSYVFVLAFIPQREGKLS